MLDIYANGPVYCSVCTDLESPEEVEAEVNKQNPTGIQSAWKVASQAFKDGKPNPCPCNEDSNKKHFLMVC